MTLIPGTLLGPYEILAQIGAGGMGVVYRAVDTRLGRSVAIKVLPPAFLDDASLLARFEQEARTTGSLNHPNILSVFDVGTHLGSPYLVMELLEGTTLRETVGHGPGTVRQALAIIRDVARGLAAAHARGVIHRDLKPENLFLTRDGQVKILDFGLATYRKDLPSRDAPTRRFESLEGMVVGTLGYMSPEQVQGLPVDERSDLFSLGVILWELLTGAKPFSGATPIDLLHAALRQELPELDPALKVPPVVERILRSCLAKDPQGRFHSAHDLAFALEALSDLDRPAAAPTGAAPGGARKRVDLALTAIATLGLAAVLGGLAWRAGLVGPGSAASRPAFTQVTFRRGNILSARFAPDGQTLVYSALWDGRPSEIYTCRTDGTATRALGLPRAVLQAVNDRGGLLVITKPELWMATTVGWGTLALAAQDGTPPRDLLEGVVAADFGPDGTTIAAIVQPGPEAPFRLEYPLGTPLLEDGTLALRAVRVAPRGDRVAVAYRDKDESRVAVLDRAGRRRELYRTRKAMDTFLAWSPDGARLYFQEGLAGAILSVDLRGRVRRLNVGLTSGGIQDVSSRGQLLLERELGRSEAVVIRNGQETNLSVGDATQLADLSRDGAWALLTDFSWGRARGPQVFLRSRDGAPPRSLGQGFAVALSPDAQWALVWGPEQADGLRKVPTGAGRERPLRLEGWNLVYGEFPDDTGRVVAWGSNAAGQGKVVEFLPDGTPGRTREVPSEAALQGFTPGWSQVVARDENGQLSLWPLTGGAPTHPAFSLDPLEFLAGAAGDQLLATHTLGPLKLRVDKVALGTGTRTPMAVLSPHDPVGFIRFEGVNVSRDGSTLGYSSYRVLESNLFVSEPD